MTATRYGNLLTVLLVILIVAILIGLSFLVYNVVKNNNSEEAVREAIAEFDKNIEGNEKQENSEQYDQENTNTITPPSGQINPNPNTTKKKTYYEGYVMIGYINIPKTKIKLPILDSVSPDALNTSVAVLYPSNAQLNEPGNTVIIGHNYRNGKFFSDNDKLSIGDKVIIKDTTGRELSYTIYQKFQTTEQDTSFYTRDTNGVAEITLSTCTDDSKARIIILAKAD